MRPSHLQTRYKFDLSPRQTDILERIARGETNAQIAEALGITLDGAKYHVREILAKLGVSSREEAVAAWRAGGTRRRWRWVEAMAIGGGIGKGLGIVAAALGAGAIAAVALFAAMGDSDPAEPGPAHAPSVTPTPSPGPAATATVRVVPSPTPELPTCTTADIETPLEAIPEGDVVRLRLRAEGATPCKLEGNLALQVLFPPTDPSPVMPPLAVRRNYPMSLTFPASTILGEWTWANWCGDELDVPFVVSFTDDTSAGPRAIGMASATVRPACVAEGAPSTLRDELISAALGGERFDATCDAAVAGWLCQFAEIVAADVTAGRLDRLIGTGHSQIHRCTAADAEGEFAALCTGAGEGEARFGFPLALHGSENTYLVATALAARIRTVIDGPSRPSGARLTAASVGGPWQDLTEEPQFIVAIATDTIPAVVYFAFVLRPGQDPTFVGAGISGDNASTILNGGTTISVLGEAEFVPLRMR